MPSITFNGIDLSAYGLSLLTPDPSAQMAAESYQMAAKSYSPESKSTPKQMHLGVSVIGTSRASAEAYLDSIKAVLNLRRDGRLVLSNVSTRYWLARYVGLSGAWPAPSVFEGTLSFVCNDPCAYAMTGVDVVHAIDADPKEISLSVAGSADAYPVLILTAGEAWNSTLTILNAGVGMSLTWAGSLTSGQRLTIDCRTWYVSLEGSAAMTGVGGQFPVLVPGTNLLSVTGFGSLGSLRIKYNARYM
jgi:predicted phage tail component-like protein